MLHTLISYYPIISASFDDAKDVDGEVFMPDDGAYDFRKFTLNCSKSRNFTATIDSSGHAQMIDYKYSNTINVLEWDKMTKSNRELLNSSLLKELAKPSHSVDGVEIIDVDYLSAKLYASYAYDEDTNTAVYLSTPSEAQTVEMIKTLKFKKMSK